MQPDTVLQLSFSARIDMQVRRTFKVYMSHRSNVFIFVGNRRVIYYSSFFDFFVTADYARAKQHISSATTQCVSKTRVGGRRPWLYVSALTDYIYIPIYDMRVRWFHGLQLSLILLFTFIMFYQSHFYSELKVESGDSTTKLLCFNSQGLFACWFADIIYIYRYISKLYMLCVKLFFRIYYF